MTENDVRVVGKMMGSTRLGMACRLNRAVYVCMYDLGCTFCGKCIRDCIVYAIFRRKSRKS